MDSKRSVIANLLVLAAIGVLVALYYSPIWWVSLTAPNYPEEAFPDGVRIHFHMNGVFNGCKKIEKDEILEVEALDCVHEMDTINHYVGMYPIAAGGVIERAFSPFLISMLGVMLLGFTINRPAVRTGVLGAGFAVIAGWMYLTYYGDDGLQYQNKGFISALVTALDQDTSRDEEVLSPGELRVTFEKDQQRKPAEQRREWDGSGAQMLAWHYEKTLGRYFNVPEEINPMVSKMTLAADVMFWGVVAAMVLLLFGSRKTGSLLYWSIGFGLMLLGSLLTGLAALIRRKQLAGNG
jgi:hypothetical protein